MPNLQRNINIQPTTIFVLTTSLQIVLDNLLRILFLEHINPSRIKKGALSISTIYLQKWTLGKPSTVYTYHLQVSYIKKNNLTSYDITL